MMETRRLYYENVYMKEFHAKVLECREAKKGYHILLDQSAFYPEGGGQPSDIGYLNETEVKEVHEKGEELLHYTDEPLEPGTEVTGRIDWERRFDLMQQHSGEHIVSGLIHEAFGYDNVGFHMGSDIITIDFNGMLDERQMAEIEAKANQKIWENSQVEITYPSPEELKELPYRSKKELTGKVRIVRFPGADICACCGTHVTHTGEIGMVKLLSVVKFREGVRMEMSAGRRVLDYLNMVNEQNHQVSVRLSAKTNQTAAAVQRLWEENFRLKGCVHRMEEEIFANEAAKCAGAGDVLLFQEGLEADSVRKLADAVTKSCGGRCAVFSRNEDGSYKYAMGQADGDLRQLTKEMNRELQGRGGGKPNFVQGSVQTEEKDIKAFFQKITQ
ncbi:MAG: alanyl-tRNA editing protein [Eubacteriales bacterium]|nr:alanyl-tRNA editing protein [Eubacteriales bacterium]